MHTLGLDISSNSTGWAVLDDDTVVDYGVITTTGDDTEKLIDFYSQLNNVLSQYPNIEWVGIEDTYVQNITTTKVLCRYHGVALLVVGMLYKIYPMLHKKQVDAFLERKANPRARPKIPAKAIYFPMPTEVFSVLGIHYPQDREKKKQEAIDWVRDNLYIDLKSNEDDKADAICIAFAAKEIARKLLS